jgi:hypothetical protein
MVQPPSAFPTPVVFELAGIPNEGWASDYFPRVTIDGIFKSNRMAGNEPYYVFQINNLALKFSELLKPFGTCILESMVKKKFDVTGPTVVEKSKQLTLNKDAGAHAAGGVFFQVGTVLNAIRKDGRGEKISIVPLKPSIPGIKL